MLKYGRYQTMSNEECLKLSSIPTEDLVPEKVCAASLSHPSSTVCNKDSGGPLVVAKAKYQNGYSDDSAVIYGIVSYGWGRNCGTGYGSVFTRVSSYLPWIKSHMESSKYLCIPYSFSY